jgi:uncharacterized cofD-like protein
MPNKNIVTIGGGTGSFVLLSGLKKYPINISAIVSMVDDGGSTGVLRDELGVLPPGDVRQCLVALSESSEELRDLMGYRFESGSLNGHSFGNIFLSALEKMNHSFSKGVEKAIKILNVKGEVVPVIEKSARLFSRMKNGKILKGQKELDCSKELKKIGLDGVYLNKPVKANPKAISKIKEADFIIIGPGDLYGSIIPNFLAKGIGSAVARSKAKVILNCNLTNKKGQTDNFDLDDYVDKINECIGKNRIEYVIFNNHKPALSLAKKYEKREGKDMLVEFNEDKDIKRNYEVIRADLLAEEKTDENKNDLIASSRSFIRHDSDKLARALFKIFDS